MKDIIVDALESTRSQPYDPASAYTFAAADILQCSGACDAAEPRGNGSDGP